MKRLLLMVLAAIVCGCGEEVRDDAERLPVAQNRQIQPHLSASTSTALPANPSDALARLKEMRKSGDTNAYVRAARDYLAENRDDIIAADILAIYARRRDAGAFRSFALQYAGGDTANLLETAEVADNESWPAMSAAFAQIVAHDMSATFGQLFRAAQFIANAPDEHLDENILRRLEDLAEKDYQREDVALLRCLMDLRRAAPSRDTITTLERLCTDAMMPQVRKKALEILDAMKEEP